MIATKFKRSYKKDTSRKISNRKKIKFIMTIIAAILIMGSVSSSATVRNQWNAISDIFPEVTQMVGQPDNIIKIDNNYINPKAISSIKVTSQISIEITLGNNARYPLLFENSREVAEFLNTVLNLMK